MREPVSSASELGVEKNAEAGPPTRVKEAGAAKVVEERVSRAHRAIPLREAAYHGQELKNRDHEVWKRHIARSAYQA